MKMHLIVFVLSGTCDMLSSSIMPNSFANASFILIRHSLAILRTVNISYSFLALPVTRAATLDEVSRTEIDISSLTIRMSFSQTYSSYRNYLFITIMYGNKSFGSNFLGGRRDSFIFSMVIISHVPTHPSRSIQWW